MEIFDKVIINTLDLLNQYKGESLRLSSYFGLSKEKTFIFPSSSYIELGASSCPSCYLISYTSNESLVNKDETILIGKDIKDLKGDVPFARIAFLLIEDEHKKDQQVYRTLRDIEYKRYKLNLPSYMARFNTNQIREGARLDINAIKNGLSFADIGYLFASLYKESKEVKAVKQIFITDPSFDYKRLREISSSNEEIVVALDSILKKLKMDCATCSFKDICDEIEGMRDIHKKENA